MTFRGLIKKNTFKYTLFGTFFGLCFPVIAFFILDYPVILFSIICTAPFFLGLFAYIAGVKQDNIESEVLSRTEELEFAKIELESALKVKNKFLATMSHEIRTPLNGVISCVTLLKDSIVKEENILLLNTIQDSGNTLLALINDILDLSKIQSGKLKFEKKSFNVKKATEQVYALYKGNTNNIATELIIKENSDSSYYLIGDVVRFKQILSNILGNAIKFAKNRVEVTFVSEATEEGYANIKIKVKDNGIGISEKNQKNLFSDFQQADRSTTRIYGGTGLGLAICKRLVKRMNGKITLQSELGHGSEFEISLILPISKEIEKAPKKQQQIDGELGSAFPLNILVAEDNKVNQLVIRKMMEKMGFSISIANNGKEAISSFKEGTFDLIFMDMHMPEMDGIDATIEIRKLSSIKIVALTANAFAEDKEKCLSAGMNDFLTKPLKVDELSRVISETYIENQKKKAS